MVTEEEKYILESGLPPDEARFMQEQGIPPEKARYLRVCGTLTQRGDRQGLHNHLAAYPQYRDEHVAVGSGECRDIDYMQYSIMSHVKDDSQAIALLSVLAEFGADFNRSHYTQASVGYLQKAVERGLAFVRFYVEHGAHVNHDLFGRPASWPLLSAVAANDHEVVRYLVGLGAVVNFVNIHGLSPLDYARPGTDVHAYLLSLGALPGSELPRDHLPKHEPEPAEPSRNSARDHLAAWFEGVTEYPLREIVPGDPPLTLLHVPEWDGGYVALVTDGASAWPMPAPTSDPDAVRRAEYAILLPPDWPLTEAAMCEDRYRWPIDWLRQVARWPAESGGYYRKANIVANGDPSEPLGPECPMTCLLVRTHGDPDGVGSWKEPDGETVELMILTPLHTAERDFELMHGLAALLDRLNNNGCDGSYHPERPSTV